jgi:hypothetical protein
MPRMGAARRGILPGMSSEIEDLHEEVFGFRPAKAGTAYERLGAIVGAARGATDVVHDETVTPPGRQAAHQLDVTCRLRSGELERVVIEFKDKESGDVGLDGRERRCQLLGGCLNGVGHGD